MSKKIIVVAILMLAIIVVFAACKNEEYEVSYTIPVENGENIEVYKDEAGNEFVTNVNGDKIPVTTDADGFYDDVSALVTQTTVPATEDSSDKVTTTTKPVEDESTTADKGTTTTKPAEDENTTSGNNTTVTEADKEETNTKPESTTANDKTTETTTENTIIIGGEVEQEDTISWQEIKDAAKKANKS